jgi:hypothetical protein
VHNKHGINPFENVAVSNEAARAIEPTVLPSMATVVSQNMARRTHLVSAVRTVATLAAASIVTAW